MVSLIDSLCKMLNCEIDSIGKCLKDTDAYAKAIRILRNVELKSHCDPRKIYPVGFTLLGASDIDHISDGPLVEYYPKKYSITLKHTSLPCLVVISDENSDDYEIIPFEVMFINNKI